MMTASEFFGQFLSHERLLEICPDIKINIPHPDEYMYCLTSQNNLFAVSMKEIEAKYVQYLEHHEMDMKKIAKIAIFSNGRNDFVNFKDIQIGSITSRAA